MRASSVANLSIPVRAPVSIAMAIAALLGGAVVSSMPTPAFAQEQQQESWETGCAYRSLPTGNGEAQRTLNCERQKICQTMANAKGATMMELGCFFVQPTAKPVSPQPGRLRPTQQQ